MIENFNNIFYLILFILYLVLIAFYTYRCLFDPSGMVKEFNTGKESIYLYRVIGTFTLAILITGIYILLSSVIFFMLGLSNPKQKVILETNCKLPKIIFIN